MEIRKEDLIDFTLDPKTVVRQGRSLSKTYWRVDWRYKGLRLSVGLEVTDDYLEHASFGQVTPLLELRRLITKEMQQV